MMELVNIPTTKLGYNKYENQFSGFVSDFNDLFPGRMSTKHVKVTNPKTNVSAVYAHTRNIFQKGDLVSYCYVCISECGKGSKLVLFND
jgi:hypothetical protein